MNPSSKICRSALNRTGILGFDYCLNPYTGCAHACCYCYAAFMQEYSGHTEPWGTFVDAKTNIAAVLSREVRRRRPGPVVIGSVCDAYQPAEADCGLLRSILPILTRGRFPFRILTKSALVTRDIDLIRTAPGGSVSFTITTLDDRVQAVFEPGAARPEARLLALTECIQAGIETGAFLGPLLPGLSDTAGQLHAIMHRLARTGVRRVLVDRLNYLGAKWPFIQPRLLAQFPHAVPAFEAARRDPAGYAARLRTAVAQAAAEHNLPCEVVF